MKTDRLSYALASIGSMLTRPAVGAALLLLWSTGTAFSQDDLTRRRVDALLGARDVAVSPEQWSSLDATAGVILEAIAADPSALPTRRARALEGIVALQTARSNELLVRFAHSEAEPLVLRMSAVHGLGRVLSAARLMSELMPILQTAQESRLRGVVAEVLSRDPAGRTAVLKLAAGETPAWRRRFLSGGAPGAAGASLEAIPGEGTVLPGVSPSEPPASGNGKPAALPNTINGTQTQVLDLGTVNVSASALTAQVSVTVPSDAVSISFEGVAVSDTTSRVVVYRLFSPTGKIYDYGSSSNAVKIAVPTAPNSFCVVMPNTTTLSFQPGTWTVYLLATKQTTAEVKAIIKTAPVDLPSLVNMNLFFVGLPNLNATSAKTDPNFQTVINSVRQLYSQVGISLGSINYIDITGAAATAYSDLPDANLPSLMKLSNDPGAQANAVNMFFVHTIVGGGLSGYIILGESAGIPGNPFLGTTGSGVAVTTANFPAGLADISSTWAHEMGHWLGLFHPTEANGYYFDPLLDTPECPRARDANANGLMEPSECVGYGADNIMFWTSDPAISHAVFTANQNFVLQRNPVVMLNGVLGVPTPPVGTASAIQRVYPQPSRAGKLTVQFVLGAAGPARLELLDVAGRLVATRDVRMLGTGIHVVDLAQGTHLNPGVYMVRFATANRQVTTRAVVLQ